jgi:hypothetical protein
MKPSTTARLGLAALALAGLASCGPATQLTSSWADPAAANRSYQKIAIVGATPRAPIRRKYEDAFAKELEARGISSVPSYQFAGEGQLDKDAAGAKLREAGCDAVIVTRLVDQETVQTYYPPTYSTMAAPSAYYGGWYGYYSMGYTYMSSPGYVSENQVYKLETNLYDVTNDKLVYSGLTETEMMAGDQPETEIKPLVSILISDMEKKKIVPKKA